MAYIKLSEATNTGKGFITHEDWVNLSFEGHKDIFKVTGKVPALNAWIARVGGTVMADATALATLKQQQIIDLTNEIAELDVHLAILKSTKTALEAI